MRPVAEAAEAWRDRPTRPLLPGDYEIRLARAINAWRAAQPDQTAPNSNGGSAPSSAPADPAGLDFAAYVQGVAEWEPSEDDKRAVEHQADPAGLDAAIEARAFTAAGLAMVPFGDEDEDNYFEWHECIDQPNCLVVKYGQPCACSGMPWPSPAVQAAVRAAAPHLRAAALNEAADETGRLIAGLLPASQWGDGYVHGVTAAEQMLRERAGREATT